MATLYAVSRARFQIIASLTIINIVENFRPLIWFPGKQFGVLPVVGGRGVETVEARHH